MDFKFKLLAMIFLICLAFSVSAAVTLTNGYTGTGLGVDIKYPGKWTGSITVDTQMMQINGNGNTSYTVSGPGKSIDVEVVKIDGLNESLILSLMVDGEVVDSDKIYGPTGEAMVIKNIGI
jgi:hypothetical protein